MRAREFFLIALLSAALAALLFALTFFVGDRIPGAPQATAEAQAVTMTAASGGASSVAAAGAPSGTFVVSAESQGRQEIFALAADGSYTQLTTDYSPARAPALSPDGKQIAFQSHKEGNWEIYSLQLGSGQVTRLTNDLAYDGAPSWSPDGKKLAFESYRSGDLDIWVINADGSNPVNLTPNEPEYDYGPSWAPAGDRIVFTSWATGHKQIWVTSPDGKTQNNISNVPFSEEQPTWSPDGKRLAFVSNQEGCEEVTDAVKLSACQRREVFVADWDGNKLANRRQVTFEGRSVAPFWSPDGKFIAYLDERPGSSTLRINGADAPALPRELKAAGLWTFAGIWTASPIRGASAVRYPPLYEEKPIAAPVSEGHPYELRPMTEIYLAPSWGQLSSRVSNSFLSLRSRVKAESGLDFLGTLSDMTRLITSKCDVHCDNLSWHKSGRAVDTQLELMDRAGRSLLEITRDDEAGETFWRLSLRATAQDGTMGEPLKDAPWDWSYHSRAEVAPEQGGVEEGRPPRGYYVDLTDLARQYGWNRISSHDDPDFDWRSNRLATEYWHYQKTDGMNWFQALTELYSPAELAATFEWNQIKKVWSEQDMRLYLKGIPPPPVAWKWYALIP